MPPSPRTATKIQCPPDAKHTAFVGTGGHHLQMASKKSHNAEAGWIFTINPSWPTLLWLLLPARTLWRVLILSTLLR